MIYRGWSLITGPAVMVGGVAAALLAVDYVVKQIQEPYAKPPQRKQGSESSSK